MLPGIIPLQAMPKTSPSMQMDHYPTPRHTRCQVRQQGRSHSTHGLSSPQTHSPTQGLLVFDTTTHSFWYHTGTQWQSIASSAAALSAPAMPGYYQSNLGTDLHHFLGTIDDAHLHIRVNDKPSGLIDQHNNNATWGYNTGKFITTGFSSYRLGQLIPVQPDHWLCQYSYRLPGIVFLIKKGPQYSYRRAQSIQQPHRLCQKCNKRAQGPYENTGGYSNTGMGPYHCTKTPTVARIQHWAPPPSMREYNQQTKTPPAATSPFT